MTTFSTRIAAAARDGERLTGRKITPAASLNQQLGQETASQRQRALRALLQHPLLTSDGVHKIEFGLVRRHAEWLREWLAQNAGWSLVVDSELARLRKTSEHCDGSRPARDVKNDTPFSRRRYVLFCLALAVLEREDRQTTLGRLADKMISLFNADPALAQTGITFDLQSLDQRRDLVQVVRLLLDLHVVRRINGDEEQYLTQKGDALYTIFRPALAAMLCVKRGPSTVTAIGHEDRVIAVTEEPIPDTDQGRNRQLRATLMRKLLDTPVVYYDELTEEEHAYLQSQRGRLLQQVEQATGLVAEVRREGIAMLDPRGDLTDIGLPEEGTDGHLTLLVAQYLADELRRGQQVVGEAALTQFIEQAIQTHRKHWRKDVNDAGAADMLMHQTVERLRCLSLVRQVRDGIRPLPAVARYAVRLDVQNTLDFDQHAKTS